MATLRRNLDADIAHMPGVREAVAEDLEARATRVRAVVAAHRRTGDLESGLTVRTNRVDSTITLEDAAVFAINDGHVSPSGSWVEGIHAIEAGL